MDWVVDENTAKALLMQYSEWLDVEAVQVNGEHDGSTHEDLVAEFIAHRNPDARPKVLT